jgi:uncharacterized integral membrane protein
MAISVFLGVLLARLGYMTAAAVASVFPGIFLTTMVMLLLLLLLLFTLMPRTTTHLQISTWVAQGPAVPMGAVGPMSFGSLATSSYAGDV